MKREDLIFEIHKASPMYSTKALGEMSDETLANLYKWAIKPAKKAKVVKDENLYDQQGNKVSLEETEKEVDLLDPYDTEYVENTDSGNPYRLSAWEKRFLRKVSILENKLRNSKIPFEWMERTECFRVARYVTEYPQYRYVRVNMEENDYSFGTEKEDLFFDHKVSAVVDEVKRWTQSNLKKNMQIWKFKIYSVKKYLGVLVIESEGLPSHKEICEKAKAEFSECYTYRLTI